MRPQSEFTRRRFLQASAGLGSLSVITGTQAFSLQDLEPGTQGETPHFYYRLAPAGPYIDSQRGSMAFGFDDKAVYLSQDNAKTWRHRLPTKDAANITFSQILGNGNVLFATRTQLLLWMGGGALIKLITVEEPGSKKPYFPHKPIDPNKPGWYFHPLDGEHCWEVNVAGKKKEMLVWGNYCNVLGGAAPVNMYYSTDYGETVKLAYNFGQSPRWQQKGAKPDQLLGDPDNPTIARHIHSVAYNPEEDAYYACTGDHDETDDGKLKHECHWLRGTYDWKQDTWDWQVVVSASQNSRYKSGGINFVDGQLYFAADANGKKPHDRGIFRCDPEDLADKNKHTKLFDPTYEVANMLIEDGVILSGHYTPVSPYHVGIIYSPDLGKTWAQYDLKGLGKWSPTRFHKKNADGWFRVDLRERWIKRGKVLFIKPKTQ